MKTNMKKNAHKNIAGICAWGQAITLTGCKSTTASSSSLGPRGEPAAVIVPVANATPLTATAKQPSVIRIKAGVSSPITDSAGNVWLADQGFEGGEMIARPDVEIANTKSPEIYRAERNSMESFKQELPNGKYPVKLHFAETFEGIWPDGKVSGLRARGGFEVEIVRRNGALVTAKIKSLLGNPLNLRLGDKVAHLKTTTGKKLAFNSALEVTKP